MILHDAAGRRLDIVLLGLSITSSWGNGHATNYRALTRALARRGHRILFLERDVPWYAASRDLPAPGWCETVLYTNPASLMRDWADRIRSADLVLVGSYVPDGVEIGHWVIDTALGVAAFYDIDTPVTVEKLESGDTEYLSPELARRWHLYLSFTAGPILDYLRSRWGVRHPRAFPCLADIHEYRPMDLPARWLIGYMGTWSADRQPALERLLLEVAHRRPADRFVVAGSGYPRDAAWPDNVDRIEHLAPADHCAFYNQQRFTLNLTRRAMVGWGHSPSVRLFEAAACGVPAITDTWTGIGNWFEPGAEILAARTTDDVLDHLARYDEAAARELGRRARTRVLHRDSARHRAIELERLVLAADRLRRRHLAPIDLTARTVAESPSLSSDAGE